MKHALKSDMTIMKRFKTVNCLCLLFLILIALPLDSLAQTQETEESTESSEPVICKTGIYLKNIRINQAEETFETFFYWWIRVDSIDLGTDYSHIKDFEIINAEAEVDTDYVAIDSVNMNYLITGRCKALIPYKANFTQFPFDIQSLVISMEHKTNSITDLVYVPDNITRPINSKEHNNVDILNGDQYFINGLRAKNSSFTYETNFGDVSVETFDQYSRMSFEIDINRNPLGIIQKMALPLLVVLILSYLVFFIPDYEIGTASALTVTALLAAIAFQWTLNDALPKVSYLTTVDRIFYLVYFYIFYAMAQTVYTFNLNKQAESLMEANPVKAERLQRISDGIESYSRFVFPLTFFIILYFIVR